MYVLYSRTLPPLHSPSPSPSSSVCHTHTWISLQGSEFRFLEFSLSMAVSSLPVAPSVKSGSTKKRLKTSRAPSRCPALTSKK